ncbi:hypothetical protein HY485_01440 [Candidatus Woesearchaeota archaeon]|nr:hypothetical protein [Candidatus Woesearchaeota archaeon]
MAGLNKTLHTVLEKRYCGLKHIFDSICKHDVFADEIIKKNSKQLFYNPNTDKAKYHPLATKPATENLDEKITPEQPLVMDQALQTKIEGDLAALTDREFFDGVKMTTMLDDEDREHNNVFLVVKNVKHKDTDYNIHYIFKPTQKQDKDRLVGSQGRSETLTQINQTMNDLAASIVDEAFGFGLFEEVQIRKHPVEGIGSVRKFMHDFKSLNELINNDIPYELDENELNKRMAFRYIVNEIDTNLANWGIQTNCGKTRVKIIDISQSFGITHDYNDIKLIHKTLLLKEQIVKVNEYELMKDLREATSKFTDFDEQIEGCFRRLRELKAYLSAEENKND